MEEEMLHSINAMRTMEIIDINTGRKLGFIKDIKIDCNENKIVSIILHGEEYYGITFLKLELMCFL